MPNLMEIGSRGSSGEICKFFNYHHSFLHTYIPFSFAQPSGQSPKWILTHDIPKCAESCKVKTFGG